MWTALLKASLLNRMSNFNSLLTAFQNMIKHHSMGNRTLRKQQKSNLFYTPKLANKSVHTLILRME